ncbi:MAG: Cytochrome C oxidase, cbb3-type, subunit III [Candidatus Nitrotoga sp. SPKER]|nr:MAG: Cytochrome C oxidase, cbb3-type, subunit III [Candidatus Nitrotoga sp. SPKER]
MNKVLRKTGMVVAALVVLIILALVVIYTLSTIRMNKKYDLVASTINAPKDQASITEGRRLYISRGCVDCHGADLSGQTFINVPPIGKFTGTNLTSGKGGAASTMSDTDFAFAIRHGIAPDGSALIFMPATDFQGMSDEDVGKIIAYIRRVKPVNETSPAQHAGPITRLLFLAGKMPLLVSAELINHQAKSPAQVEVGETVEYGRYLAIGCTGCHGPGFSGGTIPGGPPDWPHAKNLTPAGDLGKWSQAEFIKTMRTGVRPDDSTLKPPMPWKNFSLMTDVELKAIWMFLKTIPAKETGNR